jgi:hypothetical protein
VPEVVKSGFAKLAPLGRLAHPAEIASAALFLAIFQKDSALSQWFRFRTENARGTRKTMIVALARKLLIALWRFTRTGPALAADALCPGQEKRTMHKPEIQIGNSGLQGT